MRLAEMGKAALEGLPYVHWCIGCGRLLEWVCLAWTAAPVQQLRALMQRAWGLPARYSVTGTSNGPALQGPSRPA